ncbi:hypothetical protein O3G_MSEX009075 [Manduca sexta]|uniref:Uncharacterized protein n=1 Tax=Manduca sexta TaxID=7130 RepID=A0A922CQX8_MANSE|nr:hypothetical protein O3G_MSEX009075 [Manduca sexta]
MSLQPASSPIVISDDSIADFERIFLKNCSCIQDIYKSPRRSVQIQEPEKTEKEIGVQELFISGMSGVGMKIQDSTKHAPCVNDNSDSVADSMSGSCETSRAQYYHNKLLATMQILENKEETVRVQNESLAVAEARITSLTARISELRRDVERKDRELQILHKTVLERGVEKTDVSITALTQEKEQRDVINTLQDNLTVIEDLYRESFYETAKQECLIEMLRKSYLDVRVVDKQKDEQIDRLQTVVDNQRWSLDQCQDIALEVENLKMEITNFLNSSNNDSGMWERSDMSVTSGVGEDLHDIMDHLLRLRQLLNTDCICGLEEENARLRKNNETLQLQVGELRQRISELESSLLSKDDKELFYQEQIDDKEKELHSIRKQLAVMEESKSQTNTKCDALTVRLQQTEVLLKEKTSELMQVQQQCELHENNIKLLNEELEKANLMNKENSEMRSSVSCLTSHARSSRARLAASECRARSLEAELEHLHVCYRQKATAVEELRSQLEEAQSRGAALCGTARGALDAVARWSRSHRRKRRELEEKIQEKETIISSLEKRLEERQKTPSRMSASEEPSCSKYIDRRDYEFPPSYSSTARGRREQCVGTSESERTSCSSAPVPPRRSRRKTPLCSDKRCSCSCSTASSPAASCQVLRINRCDSPQIRMHRIPVC